MTKTEHIAAEFDRRKSALEAQGYTVDQYGFGELLIVELLVRDKRTGETLIRKQEGVAIRDRTPFLVESRKLMALERLANVLPHMWAARYARQNRSRRRRR